MEHYQNKTLKHRYRLTHKIGQGGMASVYLAEDTSFKNLFQVAIKQNIFSASPEENRLFEQEAQLLASLRTNPTRPHNLPLVTHYFNELNGGQQVQYLVMDYIEGEDLDSMIQRAGQLNEKITLFWLGQIMEALDFLHNLSPPIIHRDLKPSNIRIGTDGKTAYLVDFGLAGAAGQELGTDGFAPPEQYRGQTDTRSDIYALGATLYTLLSGQSPPASTDLLSKRSTLPPPDDKVSLSSPVKDMILQAMELKASNRHQTVAEMRQAIQPKLPTKLPKLGIWQPKIQRPALLDPPPHLNPRQTGTWWVEPRANSIRIALTADNRLLSGDSSGQIKFWSIAKSWDNPGYLQRQRQHQDWVSSLAVNRDSQLAASGSYDRTIKLWYTQTGQPVRSALEGHKGSVLALAFSPDGQYLVSGGEDRTIRCWPLVGGGERPYILAKHALAQGLAFSPDGQWLAAACRNNKVRLWNMSTRDEVTPPPEISDHDGPVFAIAFSPDGAFLATGGDDRFLHLAEIQDQKMRTALEPADWQRRYVMGRSPGPIYCLAFSPDSRLLATGGKDRMLQLWDVNNGQLTRAYGPFSDEILDVTFGLYWHLLVVAAKNGAVSLVRLD